MSDYSFKQILRKTLITAGVLALIVVLIAGLYALNIKSMIESGKGSRAPVVAVASAEVEAMEWPVEVAAIGSVSPLRGVVLSVEVPGIVRELSFKSGTMVKKGQPLVQLGDRSERAELASAEATASLAKLSLDRSRQLLERNTISQAEFDAADAEYKRALAEVQSIQVRIDKKRVLAPFDGLLGIRRINIGQYLNPGDAVVGLVSVDPINVTFFLPQEALSFLTEGLKVQLTSDVFPDRVIVGKLAALEAQVDPSTRMIEVQALVPNPDGVLRVGMFVNVRLDQAPSRRVPVVPASSVVYASFGNSIYTVTAAEEGDGFIAHQKFVKLGERRGDFVEVVDGLELGERIVINGAFKLYPGARVSLQDERAPQPMLAPTPRDS